MATDVRSAYEAAGSVWGGGPSRVYGALAQPLLAAAGDVVGKRALDVGAGAGVVASGLAARGAHVVASDLALSMLTQDSATRPSAVVGDVLALPFRSGAFDLSLASFVLNHLTDPASGLREMHRVVRSGGAVLATTFEGQSTHPAKAVVDRVAEGFGFSAPLWYVAFKRDSSPAVATAGALAEAAREAGLPDVGVDRVVVRPAGLSTEDLVDWRLGMAHLAGFVAGLAPQERDELRTEAIQALSVDATPLELVVLVLLAR